MMATSPLSMLGVYNVLDRPALYVPNLSGGDNAMRSTWDKRYGEAGFLYGTEAAKFLQERTEYFVPGGKTLVVADGEGRNSVFIASLGQDVVALDNSATGIEKAKALASERGVRVDYRHADLRVWEWEEEKYDVVVAIFIQFAEPDFRDALFKGMKRTLKTGGILLLHGYNPKQIEFGTGGPPCAANMYTTALLRDAFGNMDVLRLEEYERELDEGCGHSGMSALIDLVARKSW